MAQEQRLTVAGLEQKFIDLIHNHIYIIGSTPSPGIKRAQYWMAQGTMNALFPVVTDRLRQELPEVPPDLINAYQDSKYAELHRILEGIADVLINKKQDL
jgi:hypothetical protein